MSDPNIVTARAGRLAALEDDIRRRLWARDREGSDRDFDSMVAELSRQQYAFECQRAVGAAHERAVGSTTLACTAAISPHATKPDAAIP